MTQLSELKDWDAQPISDSEIEADLEASKDAIYEALKASGWSHEEAERMIDEAYQDEANPRFAVTDTNSCNWVLRKMAECQDEIFDINQQLQEELVRLTTKAERLMQPIKKRLEFFQTTYREQIEAFALQEAAKTKKQTIKLLNGEVKITTADDKIEIKPCLP